MLEYFVAVAEEGQMTRAARRLDVAQPALSQAIAQLEADLGLSLLERHARGVSLTPDGEMFLEKARAAVAAWAEAVETAQSLARAQRGTIEFGFVGTPPGLDSPEPLESFTSINPGIDLRYRELQFPTTPTASWLAEVDLAVAHMPPTDGSVWLQPVRREPRVLLVPRRHRLAERQALAVAEVLGETFVAFHPSVDPGWAGFWSLDDERGRPPDLVTPDRASGPQEVLASLVVRDAVTTVPASVARFVMNYPGDVVTVPLLDAAPVNIVLAGRLDRRTSLVEALLAFVRVGGPVVT